MRNAGNAFLDASLVHCCGGTCVAKTWHEQTPSNGALRAPWGLSGVVTAIFYFLKIDTLHGW